MELMNLHIFLLALMPCGSAQCQIPAGCVAAPGAAAFPGSEWVREAIHERTGMELVFIPGGSFFMGSRQGVGYDDEQPRRRVEIRPFYMGKFEVTNGQYNVFAAEKGKRPGGCDQWTALDRPAICVDWYEASEYCGWAGLRLPTEAEWEYACRAGSQSEYFFGDDLEKAHLYGWNVENSDGMTHPVGEKKANPWGLHDMSGNVFEWCQDFWHENYVRAPKDGRAWVARGDPHKRVMRGGSWGTNPEYGRSALRFWQDPGRADDDGGFRAVLELP